jgi:DNA replication protein DnaC
MRLEGEVCDFLEKMDSGEFDPWKKRYGDHERNENLRALVNILGPRYRNCTLANFQQYDPKRQCPVLKALNEFAVDMPNRLRGGGIIFIGNPGTGKDHLMAALLKIAVARHRLSAAWWDGGTLYDAIAAAISDDTFEKLRRRLLEPQILAISDPIPPRGNLTDPQLRRLRDAVDRRYRATKSTWITTNVDTTGDAEALLTKPVLERITEGALQIFCDWESYRTRKSKP